MATEVEFHTGVADVLDFATRLLRKAYRLRAQVLVTAPEADLAALDRHLWTQDERDFLPHVRLPAAPQVATRTPIWLADAWPTVAAAVSAQAAQGRVCINLGADVPPEPAGLLRIIEVVGLDAAQVEAGRQRWRQYKALGLSIVHHGPI